ncbi:MAG: membrane-bound metal-dependent hydrolase YbcI (DUF457 family) [Rhodothermales bacterium]|jgi:membrane-bound metal-dependent hydrolase YbcI (DUF457 family)
MVFGGSQVLMDIEPGVRMIQGAAVLHGPSHTLVGAVIIGFVAGVIGKPVTEFVFRIFRAKDPSVAWTASFVAAFTGTLSHIVLDATMHFDMKPWSPITSENGLLGSIPLGTLHLTLLLFGVIGGLFVLIRAVMDRPA